MSIVTKNNIFQQEKAYSDQKFATINFLEIHK